MSHQVLARKYRPATFAQVAGQGPVVQALTNAFTQKRLHHAYLFTGTRGVGKTTIARIIAKCLECEQGISATPCGTCSICIAIAEGRFIDVIEVDAASRTKVEDTRELLENVQYAPTQGRFKIYLIDEVHMLSGHSFNALLKTLEEPPEHVKFLLATTDPHKLPITVLSRCLQFHLKNVAPEVIAEHLSLILEKENIPYEKEALLPLAAAADGSLRDALSLLDQLIAFSNANITAKSVQSLLGHTNKADLFPLLETLAAEQGEALLQHIHALALQGNSFSQLLDDLILLLHEISLTQLVPRTSTEEPIKSLAQTFSAEDIQLFYQIALIGRRDFAYSPSPRAAFEMVMLRMLAFRPMEIEKKPLSSKESAIKTAPLLTPAESQQPVSTTIEWTTLIPQLKLTGVTLMLAQHCVLRSFENNTLSLRLENKYASLGNDAQKNKLAEALSTYFKTPTKLIITLSQEPLTTPALQEQQKSTAHREHTKQKVMNDPTIKNILKKFGGSIDENSIESF